MKAKRKVALLILIMSGVVITVETVTVSILYGVAFEEERSRLIETAKSQARLIEAVARFDQVYSRDYPDGAVAATLSQVRDAHANYRGFGKTGEFTLSKRVGDEIVFLLSHRHFDLDNPRPVSWNSRLAEPMRRALSGESGTVVGLDYRGATVLAAYEPVAGRDWGIVSKIDLSEVRAPFIRAAVATALIAAFVVIIGALIFVRVTEPVFERLRETVLGLQNALSEVRTLRGILPICSFCKRIRDDQGYWDQVDTYLSQHTDASFSHGVCPDCLAEHYPDSG